MGAICVDFLSTLLIEINKVVLQETSDFYNSICHQIPCVCYFATTKTLSHVIYCHSMSAASICFNIFIKIYKNAFTASWVFQAR